MKTRLAIFALALLLLPPAGMWLSGAGWDGLPGKGFAATANISAILLTTMLFAGFLALVNHLVKLLTGNSPLAAQRGYFLWMGAASAVLCWLLSYLNLFVASWVTQPENPIMQLLLYTPLFAMLAPAMLLTRATLGASGALIGLLSRGVALPTLKDETLAASLLALALLGLAGGAAWPDRLHGLFWLAPLLLLAALQLLWNESTIFSGLKSGNWGRVTCAALAGIIVGNFAVTAYRYNGGIIMTTLPGPVSEQFGHAAFGLLCLQLGDVVAENWRGKKRSELFQKKKKFPIPVIVRKN